MPCEFLARLPFFFGLYLCEMHRIGGFDRFHIGGVIHHKGGFDRFHTVIHHRGGFDRLHIGGVMPRIGGCDRFHRGGVMHRQRGCGVHRSAIRHLVWDCNTTCRWAFSLAGQSWQDYLDRIWIYAGRRKCLTCRQVKKNAVEKGFYKPFELLTEQPPASPASQ
jgi:hypothetical protein